MFHAWAFEPAKNIAKKTGLQADCERKNYVNGTEAKLSATNEALNHNHRYEIA
jgi:hypothetical protein